MIVLKTVGYFGENACDLTFRELQKLNSKFAYLNHSEFTYVDSEAFLYRTKVLERILVKLSNINWNNFCLNLFRQHCPISATFCAIPLSYS